MEYVDWNDVQHLNPSLPGSHLTQQGWARAIQVMKTSSRQDEMGAMTSMMNWLGQYADAPPT